MKTSSDLTESRDRNIQLMAFVKELLVVAENDRRGLEYCRAERLHVSLRNIHGQTSPEPQLCPFMTYSAFRTPWPPVRLV